MLEQKGNLGREGGTQFLYLAFPLQQSSVTSSCFVHALTSFAFSLVCFENRKTVNTLQVLSNESVFVKTGPDKR